MSDDAKVIRLQVRPFHQRFIRSYRAWRVRPFTGDGRDRRMADLLHAVEGVLMPARPKTNCRKVSCGRFIDSPGYCGKHTQLAAG